MRQVKAKSKRLWVDYDKEADVLYVSFDKPQRATDSVLRKDNILLRYRSKKLIGVTLIGTKLSTDPKFMALIKRSRVRHKAHGGISSAQMRRRLGLK